VSKRNTPTARVLADWGKLYVDLRHKVFLVLSSETEFYANHRLILYKVAKIGHFRVLAERFFKQKEDWDVVFSDLNKIQGPITPYNSPEGPPGINAKLDDGAKRRQNIISQLNLC